MRVDVLRDTIPFRLARGLVSSGLFEILESRGRNSNAVAAGHFIKLIGSKLTRIVDRLTAAARSDCSARLALSRGAAGW